MKRQLTPEQKAKSEARREKFRALAKQISSLSDDARQMLAAKLPALATIEGRILSLHNACLIAVQKPDATIVGGFRQWLDAGRCVRKGECGLMIWVPTGKRAAAVQPLKPELPDTHMSIEDMINEIQHLRIERGELLEAVQSLLHYCVTPEGFPDKGHGRTPGQQIAYDFARHAIAKATGHA